MSKCIQHSPQNAPSMSGHGSSIISHDQPIVYHQYEYIWVYHINVVIRIHHSHRCAWRKTCYISSRDITCVHAFKVGRPYMSNAMGPWYHHFRLHVPASFLSVFFSSVPGFPAKNHCAFEQLATLSEGANPFDHNMDLDLFLDLWSFRIRQHKPPAKPCAQVSSRLGQCSSVRVNCSFQSIIVAPATWAANISFIKICCNCSMHSGMFWQILRWQISKSIFGPSHPQWGGFHAFSTCLQENNHQFPSISYFRPLIRM